LFEEIHSFPKDIGGKKKKMVGKEEKGDRLAGSQNSGSGDKWKKERGATKNHEPGENDDDQLDR